MGYQRRVCTFPEHTALAQRRLPHHHIINNDVPEHTALAQSNQSKDTRPSLFLALRMTSRQEPRHRHHSFPFHHTHPLPSFARNPNRPHNLIHSHVQTHHQRPYKSIPTTLRTPCPTERVEYVHLHQWPLREHEPLFEFLFRLCCAVSLRSCQIIFVVPLRLFLILCPVMFSNCTSRTAQT